MGGARKRRFRLISCHIFLARIMKKSVEILPRAAEMRARRPRRTSRNRPYANGNPLRLRVETSVITCMRNIPLEGKKGECGGRWRAPAGGGRGAANDKNIRVVRRQCSVHSSHVHYKRRCADAGRPALWSGLSNECFVPRALRVFSHFSHTQCPIGANMESLPIHPIDWNH
ncbi:hypothetical protein EVAR_48230_1 [Eumeta japonica]|uniref:Uncharacterized protein n=1 Tax=Eumeta variegata TaxID=151549 RepID=A0A4C1YCS3_EUMVA|nr:hypothetical protein EVAR_48230_1 [Eumeta japonica]